MKIPSAQPYFGDFSEILTDIEKILESKRLILGPYTERFEENFKHYIGTEYAVAVSSCAAALEICLRFYEVKGKEVIVPANTFIACANSTVYAGGKVIFSDVNPEHFCSDFDDIAEKITTKTKAVMLVHLAGLPVPDMDKIIKLCKDKNIIVIEDPSHAHGAVFFGKKVGSLGDAACFSFYPTKLMTTCVGGMITTNDKNLYEFAKSFRHHGQGASLDDIVRFGNDWLMDEIRAAIGIHQLKQLDSFVNRRNEIAQKYKSGIDKIKGLRYFRVPLSIRHSYYKFIVSLDKSLNKNKIVENMKTKGIEVATLYGKPIYLHPAYANIGYRKGLCPKAEEALLHQMVLPMFTEMRDSEIDTILLNLDEELKK
jgi:dTDP-4-amino-4,6-dideoxygalactose transaminase